ncbi:uncharacterized protein LOC122512094 [Leptopilina heterotoma]|uniref:uncharacterized protein LOC122512094 n=1 Tax=Leptopilina heterotoma TaxID=63436 RepID=UPI001CA88277|nr:uncharacterized protein LOC122512094 [Leptopilina heterotoma]
MDRWAGKIAIVTGANSGIGFAIANALVIKNMIVVGVDIKKDKMESEIKSTIIRGKFYSRLCDVSKSENVKELFNWVEKNLGCPRVIVNCAGIFIAGRIIETNSSDWKKVINTNLVGLLNCCQIGVSVMKKCEEECQIINMCSITGQRILRDPVLKMNVYPATKHAVRAATTILENELLDSKIKVADICPGFTNTPCANNKSIEGDLAGMPFLETEDVAESVIYILGTHPRVQVKEVTLSVHGEKFTTGQRILRDPVLKLNVYPATKYAVRAATKILENELLDSKIKVSDICPGLTNTPCASRKSIEEDFGGRPLLEAEDVAESVIYILGTHPRVQVKEVTLSVHEIMNRWEGKVAIVTGASNGIGLSIAKTLFKQGMITVAVARRKEKIESEMKDVKGKGKLYALQCDVSKEEDVHQVFQWIRKNFGNIHVVINNAGTSVKGKIIETNEKDWHQVIGVNILGVLYFCKEAIKMMKEFGEESHIININSIVGHRIVRSVGGWDSNIYAATKHAITALTTTLELELIDSKIRMTSISPGFTRTIFPTIDQKDQPTKDIVNTAPIMETEDIAEAIVYILGTHPRVQVTELTIKPLGETF